jgi:hypothetical protein
MPKSYPTPSKRCAECQIVKPAGEFSAERRNRDGLQGRCKACRNVLRPAVVTPPEGYVPPESKPCTKCGLTKPLADFSPNRRSWDGRQSSCKACDREGYKALARRPGGREMIARWEFRSKLKHRYGITAEDYERILASQGGKCALCGRTPADVGGNRRFHVDHCHSSNRIRGILCSRCNIALGTFGDSLEGVLKVVEYLRRTDHPEPTTE